MLINLLPPFRQLIASVYYFIKKFVGQTINDHIKCNILTIACVPDENLDFSCRYISGQIRFSFSWLKRYTWLAYSNSKDSTYCKVCMAFAPEEVGMSNSQYTEQLIRNGFCGWKKAIERFEAHQKTNYCQATLKAHDFLNIMHGGKKCY
ncbi:hypothetical protein PR048_005643 [Dryococelus australis]|uniref:TTF-type domain-containing protein n=1 Tax=Dryococelus australis TaxID=614101 RepID=A0ABQ9I9B4_9NEOP|nr:hypothetical protein PR048_005643 [Dryococelus australis]